MITGLLVTGVTYDWSYWQLEVMVTGLPVTGVTGIFSYMKLPAFGVTSIWSY